MSDKGLNKFRRTKSEHSLQKVSGAVNIELKQPCSWGSDKRTELLSNNTGLKRPTSSKNKQLDKRRSSSIETSNLIANSQQNHLFVGPHPHLNIQQSITPINENYPHSKLKMTTPNYQALNTPPYAGSSSPINIPSMQGARPQIQIDRGAPYNMVHSPPPHQTMDHFGPDTVPGEAQARINIEEEIRQSRRGVNLARAGGMGGGTVLKSNNSIRGTSPSYAKSIERHKTCLSPDDSHDTDVVRVEVGDFMASISTTHTVAALEMCKTQIVRPFNKLLMFICWRPIGYSSMDSPTCKQRFFNYLYCIFVTGSILFSYAYQMIACQWRLNVKDIGDTGWITFGPSIGLSTPQPPNSSVINGSTISRTSPRPTFYQSTTHNSTDIVTTNPGKELVMPACEHIISTYIVPNSLHLVAYIIGFYHFRLTGSENVYALMEKVFQYCSTLVTQLSFQMKLVWRLKLYMALGVIWVLAALSTSILYDCAFAVKSDSSLALSPLHTNWELLSYSFFSLDMIGSIIVSVISMTVIYNYVVHCELVIFYADALCDKLQMRSIRPKLACSDMLNIKNAIRDINGTIGLMLTLILTIFLEMTIIGSIILIMNQFKNKVIISYRSMFVVHLVPIIFFPLIQAARVNSHCARFRRFALEMRTFGYLNASQEELDSFLLFNISNRLTVTVFRIPINGSYLLFFVVCTMFVLLILAQIGVFGSHLII